MINFSSAVRSQVVSDCLACILLDFLYIIDGFLTLFAMQFKNCLQILLGVNEAAIDLSPKGEFSLGTTRVGPIV